MKKLFRRTPGVRAQAGFTLIELLVVIAIIAVLTAIGIASLVSARNKAHDKAVIETMMTIRSQAQLYVDTVGDGSYGATTEFQCASGLFANDPTIAKAVVALQSYVDIDHVVCTATPTTFAIAAQLKSTTSYYCLDSVTNGKMISAASAPNGIYGSSTGTVISVSIPSNGSDTGLCN